jgi:predicted permease
MLAMREILRRVGYLGRRSQFDRELDDEIQFHIQTRADELEKEGAPRAEALERARREFGPRARMSEATRAAWQFQWIEDLWRDLSYAARAFAKSPGFTAVAVLSLGIGVGANFVMFTFVDALLLRPPKIPRPNEVVGLISTAKDTNASGISYPDYAAVRDRSHSFQDLAAFTAVSTGLARAGAEPQVKDGKLVTNNFFSLLGVRTELGRTFTAHESEPSGDDLAAILGHSCWQNDFGADPEVLGKQARVNGIDFTIVGVMPAQFTDVDDDLSDDNPDFYLPIRAATRIGSAPDLLDNRGERSLTVYGRLKAGVPIARARAEVAAIAGALEKEYPETNRDRSMVVRNVLEYRSGGGVGITAAAFLMILAGMVLLVACANIAGLLSSRAPARAREIAMRLAIGAGRPRLIRQLLTESLLLAAGGGLVGIAIGYVPIALGKRLALQFDPRIETVYPFAVNVRMLVFGMAVALLSVVLFGLVPAFQATRTDLMSVMKGAGGFAPRRSLLGKLFRGRNLLVAGQVAIALLLLTITTVVYAGVYKGFLTSVRNPGFQVEHLIGIDFGPATVHYKDARAAQFFQDLARRLRSTKGVQAAALEYQDIALIRPDSPVAHDDVKTSGVWVDEGFFDTLGVPILQGRAFYAADLSQSPAVAVVNNVLVRHYWPGQNAIGKQIRLSSGQWVSVIGVAQLDRFMAFGTPPMDTIFLPYGTPKQRDVKLLARSTGDPQALVDPIRRVVRDLDPDQAMPDAYTWQRTIGIFIKAGELGLDTIGAMGVLGLVLALVGLYGLIAYEVSSRTREIGIRMALGARAGAVVRMVLRQGVALAVCGIGAGVALNWVLLRVIKILGGSGNNGDPKPLEPNGGNQISVGFGSQDFGDHAFAILVMAVFAVSMLAAWLPARRAARVDPNVALRAE